MLDKNALHNVIADRASTEGQFAIAYAILALTEETGQLRRDLCLGTNFGEGATPGALEFIGIRLGEMGQSLSSLANATHEIADRDP